MIVHSGMHFPDGTPRTAADLVLFRDYAKLESWNPKDGIYTGEGRMAHLRRGMADIWGREFICHEWADDMHELFCEYQWSTVTGPAASGKTTAAAIYACYWYLCAPHHSAVVCTSTTLDGLKKRVWKEIKRYMSHPNIRKNYGTFNFVNSRTAIQSEKGDDAHGLFGIAVAAGQTEKALGRIIGFHPKRLLIVIDEMTDTPEAIVEACANLSKTEGEFQLIGLGNAKSIFDPHGKMSEPKRGWNSISIETGFWETNSGACLHIDGLKSPNIKAGKNKFPYLIKPEDVDKDRKDYGENSPKWWRFTRGFWAPQGLENLVITEAMVKRFDIKRAAVWKRGYTMVAGLDPAYGGDRCVLQLGRYGLDTSGKVVIEFLESITIQLDAGTTEPLHFQVARQAREICKDRGVRPEFFGTDATGTGAGTADILQREWSPKAHRVVFSNRATERPVSSTNPRPCREEYWNLRAEMWYSFRRFLEADQLRGVGPEAAREGCSCHYEMKGALIAMETKEDMRARCGFSPDVFDACCILLEVVRRHGVVIEEMADEPKDVRDDRTREQAALRRMDFDSDANNYTHAENAVGGDFGFESAYIDVD